MMLKNSGVDGTPPPSCSLLPVPPGWRKKPLLPPVQIPWDLHRVGAGAHPDAQPICVVGGARSGKVGPTLRCVLFFGTNVTPRVVNYHSGTHASTLTRILDRNMTK